MAQRKNISSSSVITAKDVASLVCERYPYAKVKVTNFALKPFSSETLGYLGVHESLSIQVEELENSNKRSVLTFFVKSSRPEFNEFQKQAFLVESKFFRDVMPVLLEYQSSIPCAPRCHLARSDVLVMENLKQQGYKVTHSPFDAQQLRQLMRCLAEFHSSSLLHEEKLGRPLNLAYPRYFEEKVFRSDAVSKKWMDVGIEVVKAVAEDMDLDVARIPEALESVMKLAERSDDDVNVLCHADVWSHNVMHSATNSRLVDFQMVTYRYYAVDLAQALHMNSSVNARRKLERELIGLYSDALTKNLHRHDYKGRIVSYEEVLDTLERKRLCGMMLNVLFCPITLLRDELAAEFTRDLQRYMYVDRREIVRKALMVDREYKSRVEEAVREFVERVNEECCR